MDKRLLLDARTLQIMLDRLCHQLMEDHDDFSQTRLIGLQPRGSLFARRIRQRLEHFTGKSIPLGLLDVTFYRDDFRRRDEPLVASVTDMPFDVEKKKVILIDDVLYTGRTLRAGFDALLDFGRPEQVQLLCLIERKFSRQFPIEPDYLGQAVNTLNTQKVVVSWAESEGQDSVWLLSR